MINPYSNLYIYYLDGTPEVSKKVKADKSFLGTWEDEEVSFLFFSSSSDDAVDKIVEQLPPVLELRTFAAIRR